MKNILIGAVVVVLIAIAGWLVFKPAVQTLGGTTNYDTISVSGLIVGAGCNGYGAACTGSSISQMVKGTGILIMPSYVSLAASSTLAADIAVTGVVSGDIVFAQFATSTAAGAGWEVVGASASSTSGFITLRIINNTGTAATIPASIASTTQYWVVR